MLQRWWFWSVLGVVFAVAAETLNIKVPDQHFILAVVCFILAITAWDRRKRSRGDEP